MRFLTTISQLRDAPKAKQPGHFSLKGKYGTTMHHLWKTCPFVLGVTLAFLESPYDSVTSTGARGSHDYCRHSAILPRTERAKTGDQRTAYAATSRLAGDVSGYGASCQRDLDRIVSIRAYQIALTRLVAPSAAESLRVGGGPWPHGIAVAKRSSWLARTRQRRLRGRRKDPRSALVMTMMAT